MQQQLFLTISLYLVFGLFEWQFPAEKKQGLHNRMLNLFWAALLIASGAFFVAWLYSLIPFRPRKLADRGIAVSAIIALVYCLLNDFIFYWYHRAQHHFKYFWVIHELHHSDTELNVTTSLRTYWLERPLQTLLISIPINYLVGQDARAIKIYVILLTVWLLFTHANIKLRMGFLTKLIAGPQVHRIHHSNLPEHQGTNFAQFFPFIDIIFGTYYHPAVNEFPTTGLLKKNEDDSVTAVMAKPFEVWFSFFNPRKQPVD